MAGVLGMVQLYYYSLPLLLFKLYVYILGAFVLCKSEYRSAKDNNILLLRNKNASEFLNELLQAITIILSQNESS